VKKARRHTNHHWGISMNKAELIDAMADAAEISKAAAGKALDGLVDAIVASLRKGEPVSVLGFGTFAVRERAARSGRNPKTGETITIEASRVAGFKAGKALKDALN